MNINEYAIEYGILEAILLFMFSPFVIIMTILSIAIAIVYKTIHILATEYDVTTCKIVLNKILDFMSE